MLLLGKTIFGITTRKRWQLQESFLAVNGTPEFRDVAINC
jgi:hypothetical protein